jgi:predicted MPP superfamily phosphohydrolase
MEVYVKAISKQREYAEQHRHHLIRRGWRTWLHWENMPWLQHWLLHFLKWTGLWRRGRANVLDVRLEQAELVPANLPTVFDGLRLLWLSDLHIEELDGLTEVLLDKVGPLDYDICVLGGDYNFDHVVTPETITQMQRIAAALLEKSPVYGILGNHDRYEMATALDAAGVTMLVNDHATLETDGEQLHLIGVDDCHCYHSGDWDEATAGMNRDGFRLVLSHSPEFMRKLKYGEAHMMISGHTHGGQICLPNGVPIVTGASVPRHCVKGRWKYHHMTGYTSRGVGASGVPVRFNCPGEVTLLTLKAGE